ncbi:MAG: EamA family transporter [Microthrixaceae bacterium]
MAVVLALCSSALFGVADFLGGSSARRIPSTISSASAQAAGLVVLLAGVAITGGVLVGSDVALGALAGAVGAVAVWLFYRGLALGSMSVVAPLSAVTSAIVPILVGVGLGESPDPIAWVGVAMALPAVVLISREGTSAPDIAHSEPLVERSTPGSARAGAVAGLLAGAGFGTFISLITRTSSTSGLWPLVSARATATVAMAVVLAATGMLSRIRPGRGLQLALAAGALDATSNVLVLEAGRRGLLVVVGVIGSLYPATTVILARVVLGERLQRHQVLGLGLAVVAVVLVAL